MLMLIVGCGRSDAPQSAGKSGGIERSVDAGPVHVTVRTDRDQAMVAERIHLSIEASAPEGIAVQMPAPEEPSASPAGTGASPAGPSGSPALTKGSLGALQLGEFLVKDVRESPPVWLDGRRHYVQEYTLESYTSGEQTIPALTLRYTEQPAASQPAAAPAAVTTAPSEQAGVEIKTPPIALRITSALAGEKDPAHYRDIKGPVDVRVSRKRAWLRWSLAGAIVVLLVTAAVLIWIRRRRRQQTVPEIPPGTWAFQRLRELEDERLVEQGRVHEFYFRLTDIVRQYIERRFALMAPERTTQEFLREAQVHPALADDHKRLLAEFLQTADMVKFALHEPARDDCERALTDARCFIEETAYTPAEPSSDGTSGTAARDLDRNLDSAPPAEVVP